jgi:hypothetical protein
VRLTNTWSFQVLRWCLRLNILILVTCCYSAQTFAVMSPYICETRATPQIPLALAEHANVIIGEIHGSQEAPLATKNFVCELLRLGKSVTLALEISPQEVELARKEMSDGQVGINFCRESRHWGHTEDGRASVAMWELLRWALDTSTRAKLTVVGFDGVTENLISEIGFAAAREHAMATNLRAQIGKERMVVALMGDWHARHRTSENMLIGKKKNASVYDRLVGSGVDIANARIHFASGEIWGCRPIGCGSAAVGVETKVDATPNGQSRKPKFHTEVLFDKSTPSPPAESKDICKRQR